MKHKLLVLASTILAATSVHAQEVNPMFKVGLDTGGDTLYQATFTDGSSKSIKANGGAFFGGGISVINDAKDIEAEVSLSYKTDTIAAKNGDVKWTRFPVDALVFYRVPHFRVGAGLTYHLSPKLTGSGAAGSFDISVENAMGMLLQADYGFSDKMFLGLRYTGIEYKPTNCAGCTPAKGNGVGLVFSISL